MLVYIACVEEDRTSALRLREYLRDRKIEAWTEAADLLAGETRADAHQAAIRRADFCLVLITPEFLRRRRSIQYQIGQILRRRDHLLREDIFVIPALVQPCEIPAELEDFFPVHLFESDGHARLLRALRRGAERRGLTANAESPASPDSYETHPAVRPVSALERGARLAAAHQAVQTDADETERRLAEALVAELLYLGERSPREVQPGESAAKLETPALIIEAAFIALAPAERRLTQSALSLLSTDGRTVAASARARRRWNVFVDLIVLHLVVSQRTERAPDFETLERTLQIAAVPHDDLRYPALESALLESFFRPDRFPGLPPRSLRIHRTALAADLPAGAAAPDWLTGALYVCIKHRIRAPGLTAQSLQEHARVTAYTLFSRSTMIVAVLPAGELVLYAGPAVDLKDWFGRHRLLTNGRDRLDVIPTAARAGARPVSLGPDNAGAVIRAAIRLSGEDAAQTAIAPEDKEEYANVISPSLAADYRRANREFSGFAQSLVSVLTDDYDLRRALQTPLDSWRLFLHPRQRELVYSTAPILFVQGGPGTGKTVVLAHRIAAAAYRRARELRPFCIVFIAFTEAVAQNMRAMLASLDPECLQHTVILDARALLNRDPAQRAYFAADQQQKTLFYSGAKNDPSSARRVTDLFFDEFQDFPATGPNNYLVRLLLAARESGAPITCTYDEHQIIYARDNDIERWRSLLGEVQSETLTYCYRLAREISEIAFRHRRIALKYAEDMIRLGVNRMLKLQADPMEPVYAFSGGSLTLRPCSGRTMAQTALEIAGELGKNYQPGEAALVYIDPGMPGFLWLQTQLGAVQRKLKDAGFPCYNGLAVKGLEFRAGVILFPHICFGRYYRYIVHGSLYRNLTELCDLLQYFITRYVRGAGPYALRSAAYNAAALLALGRYDALRNRTEPYYQQLNELVESIEPPVRPVAKRLGELIRPATRRDLELDVQIADHPRAADLLDQLQEDLSEVKNHCAARQRQILRRGIDDSLRDINQFYVAITRFRERAILVYDQQYPLERILPGALTEPAPGPQ